MPLGIRPSVLAGQVEPNREVQSKRAPDGPAGDPKVSDQVGVQSGVEDGPRIRNEEGGGERQQGNLGVLFPTFEPSHIAQAMPSWAAAPSLNSHLARAA